MVKLVNPPTFTQKWLARLDFEGFFLVAQKYPLSLLHTPFDCSTFGPETKQVYEGVHRK